MSENTEVLMEEMTEKQSVASLFRITQSVSMDPVGAVQYGRTVTFRCTVVVWWFGIIILEDFSVHFYFF